MPIAVTKNPEPMPQRKPPSGGVPGMPPGSKAETMRALVADYARKAAARPDDPLAGKEILFAIKIHRLRDHVKALAREKVDETVRETVRELGLPEETVGAICEKAGFFTCSSIGMYTLKMDMDARMRAMTGYGAESETIGARKAAARPHEGPGLAYDGIKQKGFVCLPAPACWGPPPTASPKPSRS